MVMYIGIYLLGTVAGLAISLLAMEAILGSFIERMQFVEIEDKDE